MTVGFHINHIFAVLLEVILWKNGCIFDLPYVLLYFLEGKDIIYHLVAYDPRI